MKPYNGKINDGLTLLKFETQTCAPCKTLGKTLDELEPEFPGIEFLSVDCEAWPQMAAKYMIRNVPTCYVVDKDGNKLSQIYGNVNKNTLKVILKGVDQ